MLPSPHGKASLQEYYIHSLLETDEDIHISETAEYDLYNIASGAYSPLSGFLWHDDFVRVCEEMCLADGTLWPIPIILDIDTSGADRIRKSKKKILWLRSRLNGGIVGFIHVDEIYPFDKSLFCQKVYGTLDTSHPGVAAVEKMGDFLISWKVQAYRTSRFADGVETYHHSPRALRAIFEEKWWNRIVAFQTRNPPHRSHEYIQKCALEQMDGLLIHPVVGRKKSWDFHDECILWAYETLMSRYYREDRTILGILPIIMRYAWPREAVLHAIVRQNYGCSHMIVGRDHAGVWDFYDRYAAQRIFDTIGANDLQIQILRYQDASYCNVCGQLTTEKTCPHGDEHKVSISGTKIREKISTGWEIPETFMRREVVDFLRSYQNPFYE